MIFTSPFTLSEAEKTQVVVGGEAPKLMLVRVQVRTDGPFSFNNCVVFIGPDGVDLMMLRLIWFAKLKYSNVHC